MNAHDAGEGDTGRQSAAPGRPGEQRAREDAAALARRANRELTIAADSAAQAAAPTEIPGARGEPPAESEITSARDALLDIAGRGHRLAHLLDSLAYRYAAPGRARPPDAHVALDQAAAAAEDLGNCAKAAAHAIEDDEPEADRRG